MDLQSEGLAHKSVSFQQCIEKIVQLFFLIYVKFMLIYVMLIIYVKIMFF